MLYCLFDLVIFIEFDCGMAKGTNKEFSRQITHTRLFDDGSLETRYEILNKLGEGSFGNVYRVKNKETNVFYAMKTIPKKVSFRFIWIKKSFYCFI